MARERLRDHTPTQEEVARSSLAQMENWRMHLSGLERSAVELARSQQVILLKQDAEPIVRAIREAQLRADETIRKLLPLVSEQQIAEASADA